MDLSNYEIVLPVLQDESALKIGDTPQDLLNWATFLTIAKEARRSTL